LLGDLLLIISRGAPRASIILQERGKMKIGVVGFKYESC
jgi:hypothetical protein